MIEGGLLVEGLGASEKVKGQGFNPSPPPLRPIQPAFASTVVNTTTFYSLLPPSPTPLPLLVFMHGSTGEWDFYNDSLSLVSTHGFAVVFPFVKSPEKDKSPFTTNTDGTYLLKAIQFAKDQNADPTSPMYQKIDVSSVIIAGHSMGATCSINAALAYPDALAVIAMHPGICGPFGPPPCPSCWKSEDLAKVGRAMPVVFTTATNDGAFWPAPLTAKHEHGCYLNSFGEDQGDWDGEKSLFAQFNADVCGEDGERSPVVKDGGHNCPMKRVSGGKPGCGSRGEVRRRVGCGAGIWKTSVSQSSISTI